MCLNICPNLAFNRFLRVSGCFVNLAYNGYINTLRCRYHRVSPHRPLRIDILLHNPDFFFRRCLGRCGNNGDIYVSSSIPRTRNFCISCHSFALGIGCFLGPFHIMFFISTGSHVTSLGSQFILQGSNEHRIKPGQFFRYRLQVIHCKASLYPGIFIFEASFHPGQNSICRKIHLYIHPFHSDRYRFFPVNAGTVKCYFHSPATGLKIKIFQFLDIRIYHQRFSNIALHF